MLNGLVSETPAGPERQAIELYRALCLVAVGNNAEAVRAIDAMIVQDPLYRPARRRRAAATALGVHRRPRSACCPASCSRTTSPPKPRSTRRTTRRPPKGFSQVLAGLNDPDIESVTSQPPLSDLKMLATGFNDLAGKAAAPPPATAPVAPAPEPVVDKAPRVYSPSDTDVVPPVTIRQAVPPYPGRVLLGGSLVMDIVIDSDGSVESAMMAGQPNPAYDRMVLQAARTWQYQPATLNGKPVKYRKRIQITLVTTPAR